MAITQIVLTSGTTWTVPADFDPNSNTVECIEGGQTGRGGGTGTKSAGATGGRSGQGGRFEGITNFQVSPGDSCTISIGAVSASHASTATNNPTWISKTGTLPVLSSDGCIASGSAPVGDFGNNGAPGILGNGNSGGTGGAGKNGGGAGGNNGAASGATAGSMSPAWTGGYAPGSGGIYNSGSGNGGAGNPYGAGGASGGGGGSGNKPGGTGGVGTQGIIVISYTPYVPASGGISFRASIIG